MLSFAHLIENRLVLLVRIVKYLLLSILWTNAVMQALSVVAVVVAGIPVVKMLGLYCTWLKRLEMIAVETMFEIIGGHLC